MHYRTGARVALGAIVAAEGIAATRRFRRRERLFAAAFEQARVLERPLVVVGDPDSGLHTRFIRAYGCGDVCLDIHGCPACPLSITADLTAGPVPTIADDSAVVFVGCVLEYTSDAPAALEEVLRIAGSPENLFVVTVEPWTVTATLWFGARWVETNTGWERISPVKKLVYAGGLAALICAAFAPKR
jgi:hypothetical protein